MKSNYREDSYSFINIANLEIELILLTYSKNDDSRITFTRKSFKDLNFKMT